jgi:hypothetical protein
MRPVGSPGRPRRRAVLVALAASVVIGAGCSPSADAPPAGGAGAPLTLDQASLLADTLHRNHEAGGASFVVTARDATTGATVVLQGQVDWTTGHGVAEVSGLRDAVGPVLAVAWTREAVAEQRTAGERFVLRDIDTAQHTADRLIAIVLGLATERPDNAQLVLQKPDAGFVRSDVLRGVDVEVLRYSERTRLWIDPTTGALLRFESSDRTGSAPVVVDLLTLGPVRIDLPLVTGG